MSKHSELAEKLAQLIAEALDEKDEVRAEDIVGLDDAVSSIIESVVVDADDIRGLDEAIDARLDDRMGDSVNEWCQGVDWSNKLENDIDTAVSGAVDDKLSDTVEKVLGEPKFQTLLREEVRKALVSTLQDLVVNLFPMAQPVVEKKESI